METTDYLTNPTQCMARGREAENEVLLRLTDNPWGGADLRVLLLRARPGDAL